MSRLWPPPRAAISLSEGPTRRRRTTPEDPMACKLPPPKVPSGACLLASLLLSLLLSCSKPEKEATLDSNPDASIAEITITPEMVKALGNRRPELFWRRSQGEGRDAVLKELINEELLLAEAYRRGLHKNDAQIRMLLLNRMYAKLATEPGEPDEADLNALFNKNKERYRRPDAITFDQVFFDKKNAAPERDPQAVLEQLRQGADFSKLGDDFWLGSTLKLYDRDQIGQFLGPEFAKAVFAATPETWTGPLKSSRGLHFILLRDRAASELPRFEDIAPQLREEWKMNLRKKSTADKLEELKKNYHINIIESDGP
jgi:hypothetical protein